MNEEDLKDFQSKNGLQVNSQIEREFEQQFLMNKHNFEQVNLEIEKEMNTENTFDEPIQMDLGSASPQSQGYQVPEYVHTTEEKADPFNQMRSFADHQRPQHQIERPQLGMFDQRVTSGLHFLSTEDKEGLHESIMNMKYNNPSGTVSSKENGKQT